MAVDLAVDNPAVTRDAVSGIRAVRISEARCREHNSENIFKAALVIHVVVRLSHIFSGIFGHYNG